MKDDTLRVLRGGSWSNTPLYAQYPFRYRDAPVYRFNNLGLRLARDPLQRLAKAAKDED